MVMVIQVISKLKRNLLKFNLLTQDFPNQVQFTKYFVVGFVF